jgi:poly-gamma-glutamate capsule biosynthesis protein CapA/YwtB (metallophosphatase superfamily)
MLTNPRVGKVSCPLPCGSVPLGRAGVGCHFELSVQRIFLFVLILFLLLSPSRGLAQEESISPWLYLRDGQPLAETEDAVELFAVGDIMIGRSVSANSQTLAQVAPLIQTADLALGNFEGVIAPPGRDPAVLSRTVPGEPYKLVMPRQGGQFLREAGFDLVSLANNHALDLGSTSLSNTMESLQAAGLQTFGVSPEPGAAPTPLIITLKGLRITFLGFTMISPPSPSASGSVPIRYDPVAAAESVKAARQEADVVVALLHWGYEYQTRPDPSQEQAAQLLLDSGADLVLGAHPHVVQKTQVIDDRFVAYSLGNFVFDQFKGETRNGLALRIYVDKGGLRAVEALPLQAGPHPRFLQPEGAKGLLARAQPAAQTLSFACAAEKCEPTSETPQVKDSIFWSGSVDLSGDGVPETIRRNADQVEILQGKENIWTSPPDWQALDLALGDPNNDGRFEMLLSLRKPDEQGISRSHPFIVGYRGGMYKLLWGGSALSSPITEVELGDLDGDGAQELVALEEQNDESNTLSVWRWHGWGFTLVWRSAPGRYEHLSLAGDEPGDTMKISVDRRWGG